MNYALSARQEMRGAEEQHFPGVRDESDAVTYSVSCHKHPDLAGAVTETALWCKHIEIQGQPTTPRQVFRPMPHMVNCHHLSF